MGPPPDVRHIRRSDRGSTSVSLRRRSSTSRHHAVIIAGDREGLRNLVLPQMSTDDEAADRRKSIWDRLGVHPFRGMWNDIHRRAPFYLSDWTDAWTYRVIPSTFDMFFKKYVHPRSEVSGIKFLMF